MEDRLSVLNEEPDRDRERKAVGIWSLANVRLEQAGNTLNYQGGEIFLTMAGSD